MLRLNSKEIDKRNQQKKQKKERRLKSKRLGNKGIKGVIDRMSKKTKTVYIVIEIRR